MTSRDQEPKKPKVPTNHKGFMPFVMNHKWDAVAYLLLFIGLITAVFNPITGGLLVGIILGIYFSEIIKERFERFREMLEREGFFHAFVVIAAILALVITTFGLFIGTVLGVFIRPALGKSISSPFDEDE